MEKNKIRNEKKMKVASIIGHFGFNRNLLNGQTIKTKNVSFALKEIVGQDGIQEIDTSGGPLKLISLIFKTRKALYNSKNIIFLLAKNGLKFLLPWIVFFNKKRRKKLHFIVIGGWLHLMCEENLRISSMLKTIDYIYVETVGMKNLLQQQGFSNILVMPNFKNINPVKNDELISIYKPPFRLCTFSRIMKEKGIEEAIKAVIFLNQKNRYNKYSLDIYGQVEKTQEEWFANLMKSCPNYIKYMGFVNSENSVNAIKGYYCLLFPTFYEGEGFAGTILDAMAAGVPTIASDWKYNSEIINDNNGVLYKTHDINALAMAIETLKTSKDKCLEEYKKYAPSSAIQVLFERLA